MLSFVLETKFITEHRDYNRNMNGYVLVYVFVYLFVVNRCLVASNPPSILTKVSGCTESIMAIIHKYMPIIHFQYSIIMIY